jgi:hypothetical protein
MRVWAAGVVHELAEFHRTAPGRKPVDVRAHRVAELESALALQHEDGGRGELLGDGCHVEPGLGRHRRVGGEVGEARGARPDDLAVDADGGRASGPLRVDEVGDRGVTLQRTLVGGRRVLSAAADAERRGRRGTADEKGERRHACDNSEEPRRVHRTTLLGRGGLDTPLRGYSTTELVVTRMRFAQGSSNSTVRPSSRVGMP